MGCGRLSLYEVRSVVVVVVAPLLRCFFRSSFVRLGSFVAFTLSIGCWLALLRILVCSVVWCLRQAVASVEQLVVGVWLGGS